MEVKLFIDPPLPGGENMARDEALLAAGRPALRFYAWRPACVSLGYFQKAEEDIDLDYLKRAGIDLVRRPTGGRAVLHDHELTYAVVLPEGALPAGVIPSYRALAGAFLEALKVIGLAAEIKGPEGRPDRAAGCFSSASAYEICVQGRKVIGSAQVRRNGSLLQHGSILLSVDYEKQARCLKGPSAATAAELKAKMAGLEELIGVPVITERLRESVLNGFSRVLGFEFARD